MRLSPHTAQAFRIVFVRKCGFFSRLPVQLLMAHWVEEDQVFDAVTTSSCNGDDVMEVKICRCSVEDLFTHGTSPFLLLEDSLRASEGFIEALQECTLLKVHLPFEVVWVGVIHNLDVSLDVYIRGFEQVVDNFLALAIHTFACKHPAHLFSRVRQYLYWLLSHPPKFLKQ